MAEPLRAPSRTAVLTAIARALYRDELPPIILDDYLAAGLAGEDGPGLRDRLEAELPRPYVLAFSRWVCVRARVTEDLVEQAAAQGVDQYVILGAGLDSFAYRRPDLMQRVRVFEVDHRASQAWKRRRLSELGVEVPTNLVFVPVDFERQALRDDLEAAGFDFGREAVCSWIGVTMYLTLDAIEATLATIAQCCPGTRLVMTYNQPRSALQDFDADVTAAFSGIATDLGEPFVSLFVRDEIEDLLRRHGFDEIVHVGPQQALDTYFNGRHDLAIAGAQRLAVATVGPRLAADPPRS